jgi:hypothetical protein
MAQLLLLPEHLLEEVLKHLLNESEPSKYHVYSRWIAGTAALSGTCSSLRRRFGEEGKKAFAEFRAWQDEEEENQMPDLTSSDDGTGYIYTSDGDDDDDDNYDDADNDDDDDESGDDESSHNNYNNQLLSTLELQSRGILHSHFYVFHTL